jgi:hypothetical protein
VYGWVALIAFLMSNFIPAILAPLVVLAAFVFAALEINQGSKIFGGIMFALCALQAWFIADHFGGLSGSLGITNPKQIEEATARKYSATNLNVPSDANQIIEQKCAEEWPRDFKMRVYCETQQYESYRALQASSGDETQRGRCAQQWPNDYRMRQYCERKR